MGTQRDGNRLAGWLMIALALAVLTVAIDSVASDHGDASSGGRRTGPIGNHMPDEVRTLLRFVDSMTARDGTAGGHEFAAAGVRYVAAALGSVATSAGLNVDAELEAIREHATHIERDPRPRERTAHARAAFHTIAALFEAVQHARFRGLEPDVANVSRAASSLRAEYRLVDQSDVVQEFFNGAASAIRAMNHEMSSPPPNPVSTAA
jgi:hypothetical protein